MTNMIERVAREIARGIEDDPDNWRLYAMSACEAIRVAIEECARVAADYHTARGAADAIRALAKEASRD